MLVDYSGADPGVILKADLDIFDISDALEDNELLEADMFANRDVWVEILFGSQMYAVLEDENVLLMGSQDFVKAVIRGIGRERGLVMHDEDSEAAAVLNKVGEGLIVAVGECPVSFCSAMGTALSGGEESFEIKSRTAFLFRRDAKENMDVPTEVFGEDIWLIDSSSADDEFAIVEAVAFTDDVPDLDRLMRWVMKQW